MSFVSETESERAFRDTQGRGRHPRRPSTNAGYSLSVTRGPRRASRAREGARDRFVEKFSEPVRSESSTTAGAVPRSRYLRHTVLYESQTYTSILNQENFPPILVGFIFPSTLLHAIHRALTAVSIANTIQ